MHDGGLDCIRRFVIGDAYARFCRARGDAVLFALGIEAFGEAVELEAVRKGESPAAAVDRYQEQMRQRFERLGVSCDWTRTVVSSQPEQCRRAQTIFLALLGRDLVYQREMPEDTGGAGNSRWLLRSSAYAQQCEQALDGLSGWTADAIEGQRLALGRVDGVEVNAVIVGGGEIQVFTPHADAIGDAAFVSVSPNHPEVAAVASRSEIRGLRDDPNGVKMVQTGIQAAVPGVGALLPVVVTPSVDSRFGPTASLGMPGRDETDREIADRLKTQGGLPFRALGSNSKPRPAARYRLPDPVISRVGAWGVPIPVVHCPDCTLVPMGADELPVRPPDADANLRGEGENPESPACRCPKCGGPATRDPETIDWNLNSMWMWQSICVPPADRESSMLSHPECDRWLPARQVIWSADDAGHLLHQRVAGRVMSDLGEMPAHGCDELFTRALIHGPVDAGEPGGDDGVGSVEELDELVDRVGADAARLTVLHAASPGRAIRWAGHSVRHSQRFLQEFRDYAEPRLRENPVPVEIDGSTRLRRRLSAWCRIAADKITASLERLEMHRATYDMMLLLKRIQDFENRCTNDGEVAPADRDAVLVALSTLVRLTSPCVPGIAAELEAIAGGEAPPSAVTAGS
jgi:leucyl-tRNA synthetase